MQHLPVMQVATRILRAAICPSCYQRRPHDELLPPSMRRECEAGCELFRHCAVWVGIAADHRADERPGACEAAIVKRVCRKSCTRPGAGDYCVYWMNRTCPLARFGAQAVAVLQALPALHALHALATQACPHAGQCPVFGTAPQAQNKSTLN